MSLYTTNNFRDKFIAFYYRNDSGTVWYRCGGDITIFNVTRMDRINKNNKVIDILLGHSEIANIDIACEFIYDDMTVEYGFSNENNSYTYGMKNLETKNLNLNMNNNMGHVSNSIIRSLIDECNGIYV
jgi:hypothetical protein